MRSSVRRLASCAHDCVTQIETSVDANATITRPGTRALVGVDADATRRSVRHLVAFCVQFFFVAPY